MACERITLPGGTTAIVCGPRKPKKRCGCGRPADLLCDWMVDGGTCDQPVCDRCTTSPAPDKDLCPAHADEFKAWAARRAETTQPRSTDR